MQLRRGFHRIGLVGLVPLCVISLGLFAVGIYTWLTALPSTYYYSFGLLPRGVPESLALGLAALIGGGLWYLSFWAIAWIIAGFHGDGPGSQQTGL
jgi:hypothetical protein